MSLKERQGVRVEVDVRFRGGGQSRSMSGRVTDLSANGLFLATKQPVPLGQQLHLEFELPTGRVEAVGEVRHVQRTGTRGLGIRFVRLPVTAKKAIEALVAGVSET
jgi:uncharacterized protein (TIGR02266 family)